MKLFLLVSVIVGLSACNNAKNPAPKQAEQADESSACPVAKTKLNFISGCAGAMLAKQHYGNLEQLHAQCSCAGKRFSVERLASASCAFDVQTIWTIMDLDKVKLECSS